MNSARTLVLAADALDDLRYWGETDPRRAARVLRLIEEVCRTPFSGTGKPEPLKNVGSGRWSRRIDQEHRLVYSVDTTTIRIVQCRYHYLRR